MSASIKQTTRLITAKYANWSGTIETISSASARRASEPIINLSGDGVSAAEYTFDPVAVWPEVTLGISVQKDDAFCQDLWQAWQNQLQNPSQAGDCVITSYNDSGDAQTTLTLVHAVIQDLRFPHGDTGQHAQALAEVVLQPESIVPEGMSAALSGGGFANRSTTAQIQSLDIGAMIVTLNLISEEGHTREFGALWDESSVAQADPQPSEYRWTQPERRSFHFTLDAYSTNGMSGSVESQYKTLLGFAKRVPGRYRSHRLIWQYGSDTFGPCYLESCRLPVWRVNNNGGAMIIRNGELTLKLLQGAAGSPATLTGAGI
jgi:hypothetical protein